MTMQDMSAKPIPLVDDDNRGYWEAAARGELRFQRCTACGRFRHYPRPLCPYCRSAEHEWARSSGTGTLYSWTIVRHAVHPAYLDVPYVIAIVEIDDCERPHVICNIDVPIEELRAGAPVEIYFEQRDDGVAVPQARPRAAATPEG